VLLLCTSFLFALEPKISPNITDYIVWETVEGLGYVNKYVVLGGMGFFVCRYASLR